MQREHDALYSACSRPRFKATSIINAIVKLLLCPSNGGEYGAW